ncbi:MAG: Tn3 family transposase [Gammaproteobacteria bacterium]|nr:Tn3 family transposase [Gammaproteobacteria bacterium]
MTHRASPPRAGHALVDPHHDPTRGCAPHDRPAHLVCPRTQAQGHVIDPADLARISPLVHRHINFLGRYAFTIPEAVARGELRPLREPNSE